MFEIRIQSDFGEDYVFELENLCQIESHLKQIPHLIHFEEQRRKAEFFGVDLETLILLEGLKSAQKSKSEDLRSCRGSVYSNRED